MKTKMYILDRWGRPQACPNVLQWASWFESHDRAVDYTDIKVARKRENNVYVSTVFLGIDHNFARSGDPVLFETMIFGGPNDGYQDRYTTRRDALKGHKKAVAVAKGEKPRDERT